MNTILSPLIRHFSTAMCVSLSCVSASFASGDVCRPPAAYSHLAIAYYDHEKSAFERNMGEANQENYNFDLQFKLSDKWAVGAGHRYRILHVDPLELQTNGHLHTFFLPLHRQSQSNRKSFRFSIAPAMSASSNVMKNPDEYESDAFQILAALIWSRRLSESVSLRYGVCGDHRFGGYKIYPSASVELQPDARWTIELGFPTSQLSYRISKRLTSLLQIAPDGNEWHVKDRSLEKRSRVFYEAWMIEWAVNWQARKHFVISASVGRQLQNRFEMTLQDESRVRLRGDPATRMGAALVWRF